MSTTRFMVRSSAHAFAGSVFVILIGLGISVVVARTLGAQGKGTYDLALSSATILALALSFGMSGGITFSVARRTSA